MPGVNVIIGVSGSGKTTRAMEIIEQKLRDGLKWNAIGFASFSRAACQEAARRASVITGVDAEKLRTEGHFKTLHAMAYRGLSLDSKSIIDEDSKSGREFVAECCGMPRGGERGTLGAKIDEALTYWETCRARLTRITEPEVSHGEDWFVTGAAGAEKRWRQKVQQIPGSAAGAAGVTNSSVPAFFDDASENSSVLCTCEDPYSPIRDENNYLLSNSNVRCGALKCRRTCRSIENNAPYVGNIQENERHSICHQSQVKGGAELVRWCSPEFETVIRQYETAKRYSGMLDFSDILFKFAGFEVDSDLNFRRCYPMGSVPSEIQVMMIDEYQDCSMLLDHCAERLWRCAGDVILLGDAYQAVYNFAGSDHRVFASREKQAKLEGKRVLLNRSYRNPNCVIEWGEQVLREDSEYEERKPFSDIHTGSVGMSEMSKFMTALPMMAKRDTMIVARTWFALGRVKDRLDQLCIPWRSSQEKKTSQWEAPVRIAIVLTMRALQNGDKISEQDFRRLTENFPAKYDGVELFKRGEKARWKKLECSGELSKTLYEMPEWGAGDGFNSFVTDEKWRKDMLLLIDTAIEKFGIDIVRSPRIQLGSCHSVKGLQAENVFCLATSSEKASQSSFAEDLCLRYVTITRASKNYRCIVDLQEHGRGRKLFLACPKNFWTFSEVLPEGFNEEGIEDPKRDTADAEQTSEDMGSEVSSVDLRDHGSARHSDLQQRKIHRNGSQDGGRQADGHADAAGEEDFSEWWSFPSDSKPR